MLLDGVDHVLYPRQCQKTGLRWLGAWLWASSAQQFAQGKHIYVYTCETRSLHQGSRLTAWVLAQDKIPVTLICDSMSDSLMRKGKIDRVIVGADRITRNAVFNKVGTYSHAVLDRYLKVPFYVAAPRSSLGHLHEEEDIVIEEHDAEEIYSMAGVRLASQNIEAYNPA
jgi:methylthioribose-1-phosphate isomerase